ncbi:hypothetical protein BU25DRAFT_416374 [Macroventuria anomochaeta]|uniref:Uncharacterized protein n=1 Tax=Macroventuria anomochaeta TaxID=301207 RepID=A0ACB6RH79_9PLEO|nr:uncharacterized protein BU25DRAFT_416374 [Macroventuria anomochaeta]KAF2621124.1 hypothetical protein BU25DRAFT_416374 [Macroventuria anomochaeta]
MFFVLPYPVKAQAYAPVGPYRPLHCFPEITNPSFDRCGVSILFDATRKAFLDKLVYLVALLKLQVVELTVFVWVVAILVL